MNRYHVYSSNSHSNSKTLWCMEIDLVGLPGEPMLISSLHHGGWLMSTPDYLINGVS